MGVDNTIFHTSNSLLEPLCRIAREAGDAIMEVYASDFAVSKKTDTTPVTKADLAANRIISDALSQLTPDIPQISEENELADYEERRLWQRYWLVDPLDGTREFVNRNDEFTVNIALIEQGRPRLGVVRIPASGVVYFAGVGAGAWRQKGNETAQAIHVSTEPSMPVRVVGSRSHRGDSLDSWLERQSPAHFIGIGSSLKFCLIAEGSADVYPRLGPTSEWDTGAAQAVVEAAGGQVVTLDGLPLRYNTKADILNPHFLVSGPANQDWLHGLSGFE